MISPIKGFDGYFVDTNGLIYSNKKNGGYKRDITPLKLKEDKDGYLEVGIYKTGKDILEEYTD